MLIHFNEKIIYLIKNFILFGVVFCCIKPISAISLSPEQYRILINNRCYNRTEHHQPWILGQRKPVGMTIDYFVSLIKLIENQLPNLETKEIVALLLKRFNHLNLNSI